VTREELLALPVSVDLVPTAARAIGVGRTVAYEMARNGTFPVPVLKLGTRYRVVTADLRRLLGVDLESKTADPSGPAAA